ncbi:MAG: PAS domain-containing protein, partial [Methanobacteriota archaeon]
MREHEFPVPGALCPKMLEEVPIAVLLIENGMFVYCNAAAVSIFQATDTIDIVGKPPGILSPEKQPDGRESNEKAFAIIQEAMQGIPKRFEWVHNRIDGTPFFAEVSLAKVEIEGRVLLQVSIIDIEHRKSQMEELHQMLDSTDAAILLIENGLFSYCNKGALELFQAPTKNSIVGQPPSRLSPRYQSDGRLSDDKATDIIKAALSGEPQRFEWVHQDINGAPFDAEVY